MSSHPSLTDGGSPEPVASACPSLLGASAAMVRLRDQVVLYRREHHPVLIEGETGSGKELVAHELHGDRAEPFIRVNCATLPEELLESELFGHTQGAFTGAFQKKDGFAQAAGSGSLLLDEVGELAPSTQAKLLRVLDSGEYHRLGDTRAHRLCARLLAATNRDLRRDVAAGRFRHDLFHRLSVLSIRVPPVRERSEDIPLLFDHFTRPTAGNPPARPSREAWALLLAHPFPGNARELRNIVIRLNLMYSDRIVSATELQRILSDGTSRTPLHTGEESAEPGQTDFCLPEILAKIEAKYIAHAMRATGYNHSRAARLLGINRTTLYSRLRRLHKEQPERVPWSD